MESTTQKITISTHVARPIDKVWRYWNEAEHIINWNAASDDWHCPHAETDLRVGGRMLARMAARDGSASFDFVGTYTSVEPPARVAFTMSDGRTCEVLFSADANGTKVVETFDPENENPLEMQRGGWQSILDNFKKYAEKQA